MGPALFCLAMRPGLRRYREEFEGEGVEEFAYIDTISLSLMGAQPRRFYLPPAQARRLRDRGQPRPDRGTATKTARPDGGEDFDRENCRRPHC